MISPSPHMAQALRVPRFAQWFGAYISIVQTVSPDSPVRLGAAAAAHGSRVLRLEPGDELTLFNGNGGQYPATLTEVRGATVLAHTGSREDIGRESPLRLTLIQGVSRGERMDWVVQKATELGVAAIAALQTKFGDL